MYKHFITFNRFITFNHFKNIFIQIFLKTYFYFKKLFYILIISMPKFNNGKITSSSIFYNRGVPNSFNSFGKLASINYEMLRTIARNNIKNGRPIYSFM